MGIDIAVSDNREALHTPKLSIGMPVFNGEKFIRQALDSLLAQTYTNFELIISDNASTDDTEAICREYAARDARIRYVRQPENRGALANFRFVLDEAVGEYFMWAAADDVWDLNWIETLLPIAEDGQCIAFGTVQTIDADGNPIRHPANGRNFSYSGLKLFRRLKYFLEPPFLGKANPIYGVYPRYLLLSDLLDITSWGKPRVDMLFMYALLAQVNIQSNPTVRLYKRIHDGALSGIMKTSSKKTGLFTKVLRFIVGLIISRALVLTYEDVRDYRPLSSIFEHAIHILLIPLKLTLSIGIFSILWRCI